MKWYRWPQPWWLGLVFLFTILFGLLTLKEGGPVLFFDGPARRAAGHYVPFVLWFNFIAGFGYVIAGVGLWMQKCWALWLIIMIATATALTFAALEGHIYVGGAYESRTLFAMGLRTLVLTAVSVIAWRQLLPREA
ncbi:hypothetical protein [Sedimenticola selenatireducens]|uniref:Uncharacterized protein n=1 Tax=Sedimenticola selenatireducens TaxID=191960 RepID=A0A557RRM8_9GAMM|nr:hypothetical protein [Sedimenticola selenatireducens]TVO67827.1 hypothetical protein FHP88_18885 [Sedimenticola selenatireducens]TVT60838.1 MAG: hypothetical protein FHK78_18700 [Sedimenticola selenatireducens]